MRFSDLSISCFTPTIRTPKCVHTVWGNYPGKRPQTVCERSISRKFKDLDALGSREVMVVMKVGIVVTVAVVVSEWKKAPEERKHRQKNITAESPAFQIETNCAFHTHNLRFNPHAPLGPRGQTRHQTCNKTCIENRRITRYIPRLTSTRIIGPRQMEIVNS